MASAVAVENPETPKLSKPRISPDQRRRQKRAKRPDLSTDETTRLKNKIGRVVCSASWLDDASKEADLQGIQPISRAVPELLEKFGIYPPSPDHKRFVGMRLCHVCGKKYPPQFCYGENSSTICIECAIGPNIRQRMTSPKSAGGSALPKRETPLCRDTDVSRMYEKAKSMGFTDREISVLSLWLDGYNLRRIGEFCELTAGHVHRVLASARDKALQFNLDLPRRRPCIMPCKIRNVDPEKLNRVAAPEEIHADEETSFA